MTPFLLGLTGSIAMGKSTTANMFRAAGVPVFDADQCVHDLYAQDRKLQEKIETAFPGTVRDGNVDRAALSRQLQQDPTGFAKLEAIVHPAVQEKRKNWIAAAAKEGADIVVLDIPLLFETGAHSQMDAVVVVHAPAAIQEARALARPGMTRARFLQIRARQMPARTKKARADYVIRTDRGMTDARLQVGAVLRHIRETRINPG